MVIKILKTLYLIFLTLIAGLLIGTSLVYTCGWGRNDVDEGISPRMQDSQFLNIFHVSIYGIAVSIQRYSDYLTFRTFLSTRQCNSHKPPSEEWKGGLGRGQEFLCWNCGLVVGAGAVVGVAVADTVETRRVFPSEPSLAG